MNPKRTGFLVAVTLVLVAFIFFYERQDGNEGRNAGSGSNVLPAFDPATVASVEIRWRTNQTLRAEKNRGDWQLTLPVSYPAYAARIEELLPVFAELNRKSHISSQDLQARKQPLLAFGLDPPVATLAVWQSTNRWELKIGTKTLANGQVYVQLVGQDGIYLTSDGFLDRLPRSVDDWRDPKVIRFRGLTFNRLKMKTGATLYELENDPATRLWKIIYPWDVRANNLQIEHLIENLRSWQIAQFITNAPNPDEFGLTPPAAVLTLAQGTNEVMSVQFGRSPTNNASLVYARSSTQPIVVLVPKEPLEILRAPINQLRENRLVSIPLAATELIEVQAEGEEKFSLEKTAEGGWWVIGRQRVAADPELIRHFFGDMAGVKIAEFVKDVVTEADFATTYRLKPPKRSYVFKRKFIDPARAITNPPIAQIDFSPDQNGKAYTRIGNENSVYAVRAETVARLPSKPFQLWDRQIWRFNTNDVAGVTVGFRGRTNTIVREANRSWRMASDTKPLNSMLVVILDEALYRFGALRADAWVTQGKDKMSWYGFPDFSHHVTIDLALAGKPHKLELDLGGQAPSGNIYSATEVNGTHTLFELPLKTYSSYFELLRHLPAAPTARSDKP